MKNEVQIIEFDDEMEALREHMKEFAEVAIRGDGLSHFEQNLIRGRRRGSRRAFHDGRITSGLRMPQMVRGPAPTEARIRRALNLLEKIHRCAYFT
jgi:hypothetical protein